MTELIPSNGRKSFGGKAWVVTEGKRVALLSYGTLVCWTDADLKLHCTWDGWSGTTGAHIQSFCDELGIPYKGKKDWVKLPTEEVLGWAKKIG